MSVQKISESLEKIFPDSGRSHVQLVNHKGDLVAISLGEDRRFRYAVLDLNAANVDANRGEILEQQPAGPPLGRPQRGRARLSRQLARVPSREHALYLLMLFSFTYWGF